MKVNSLFIFVFSLIMFTSCNNRENLIDKNKLIQTDYRMFQNTPVWELAKAVQDKNVNEIRRLVGEEKLPINYQDERFGNTLLMVAVTNDNYEAVKVLLELGSNPNLHDKYTGSTAVIDAAHLTVDDTRILKLLLQYEGDPNSKENAPFSDNPVMSKFRTFALLEAATHSLEKVKLLLEAGADVNQIDRGTNESALESALNQGKMDIVMYLLEHGADYTKPLNMGDRPPVDILYRLRQTVPPLDSKEYKEKMQVVDFLKQKGLDYRNSPIPDRALKDIKRKYPNNWEEYIKSY